MHTDPPRPADDKGTFVRDMSAEGDARAERGRLLEAISSRYLSEVAALGFTGDQAIDCLRAQIREGRGTNGGRS